MKTYPIPIGGRTEVMPENIVLLEADVNYTRLYLINGEKLLVATTLKQLEERLYPYKNFFRTSKSFIINFDYILDYNMFQVTMQNHRKASIARRRKTDFFTRKTHLLI